MKSPFLLGATFALLAAVSSAAEFHVAVTADGSAEKPFKTISAASKIAQPGDTITVHAGTYRERITPPRGGTSNSTRITYRAAPGETAIIKGSEIIRDWKPFQGDVWKAAVPNTLFRAYRPHKDLIAGDWFTDKDRPHHTGEIYFNGKALYETHLLERVLYPQPYPDSHDKEASTWTWFAEVDDQHTHLYANFHGQDPTQALIESLPAGSYTAVVSGVNGTTGNALVEIYALN